MCKFANHLISDHLPPHQNPSLQVPRRRSHPPPTHPHPHPKHTAPPQLHPRPRPPHPPQYRASTVRPPSARRPRHPSLISAAQIPHETTETRNSEIIATAIVIAIEIPASARTPQARLLPAVNSTAAQARQNSPQARPRQIFPSNSVSASNLGMPRSPADILSSSRGIVTRGVQRRVSSSPVPLQRR
jgi:hypothetical protein